MKILKDSEYEELLKYKSQIEEIERIEKEEQEEQKEPVNEPNEPVEEEKDDGSNELLDMIKSLQEEIKGLKDDRQREDDKKFTRKKINEPEDNPDDEVTIESVLDNLYKNL